MPFSEDYLHYVLDQMRELRGVTHRRMFGGACLFYQGQAFALISDDTLFLKVDASNKADFERAGMGCFAPFPDKPNHRMNYYEVPIDVLESAEDLAAWSRKSIAIAAQIKKKKKK